MKLQSTTQLTAQSLQQKAMNMLDKRIEKDLKELYSSGEIDGAVALDGLVQEENEGLYWVKDVNTSSFSSKEKKVVELLKSNSGISIEQLAVQARMTVDDLKDLLNDLKNKGCAENIKDKISFATRALPVYTGGKRDAKTVMVMLNPGKGVKASNNDLLIELKKRSMFTMLSKLCCGGVCPQVTSSNVNLTEDIKNYHHFNAHYGDWDCSRQDAFDLKQAFFLRDWPKDSDINLGVSDLNYITQYQSSKDEMVKKVVAEKKLKAKASVLNNKQQLELIPYASRKFDKFNTKMIKKVFPYVDTLLEEIFSADRKYVIFCSAIFEDVFKAYSETNGKVTFVDGLKLGPQGEPIRKKVEISYTNKKGVYKQTSCYCTVIELAYEGKGPIRAIIADTFPRQDITNAYEVMAAYGKFCYECYCGKHSPKHTHKIALP